MKYLITLLVCSIAFVNASAQINKKDKSLDEGMDQSLDQIESFLDTFSLDQMMQNFNMNGFMGEGISKEDMGQIQEQLKLGIEQMRGFDMTIFEDFVKELEKSFGNMGNRSFTPDPAHTPKKPAEGLKKI